MCWIYWINILSIEVNERTKTMNKPTNYDETKIVRELAKYRLDHFTSFLANFVGRQQNCKHHLLACGNAKLFVLHEPVFFHNYYFNSFFRAILERNLFYKHRTKFQWIWNVSYIFQCFFIVIVRFNICFHSDLCKCMTKCVTVSVLWLHFGIKLLAYWRSNTHHKEKKPNHSIEALIRTNLRSNFIEISFSFRLISIFTVAHLICSPIFSICVDIWTVRNEHFFVYSNFLKCCFSFVPIKRLVICT